MPDLRPGSRRRVADKFHTEINAICSKEMHYSLAPTADQIETLKRMGHTRPVGTRCEAQALLNRLIRAARKEKGKWTPKL